MFLSVTSAQWLEFLTPLAIALSILMQIWREHNAKLREEKTTKATKEVASKAAEVATKLETTSSCTDAKLDGIITTTDKVHTLVNSRMGAQLLITAKALRRAATITGSPEDLKLAEEAEALSKDHETKQTKVDIKEAQQQKEYTL
jgi:hypothetical protein